jgi:hypothetical protein
LKTFGKYQIPLKIEYLYSQSLTGFFVELTGTNMIILKQMKHKRTKKQNSVFLSFSKEQFVHGIYPVLAGIPTAILILYFIDLGNVYKDILNNLISPVITGVVSGIVLYIFGMRR